jgi:hypothetical protein
MHPPSGEFNLPADKGMGRNPAMPGACTRWSEE